MNTRFGMALVLSATLAWTACKSNSTPTPTVSGVAVTGSGAFNKKNLTSQLTATANKSDGTSENVTNTATWASSAQGVATVSSTGLVTSVGNGTANITATYQGSVGNLSVLVTLKATGEITPFFKRLCSPARAGIDITVAETGGDIGFNLTGMTVRFRDLAGNIRVTRTFSAAELASQLGGTAHLNAGQSKIFSFDQAYVPAEDTQDSKAELEATGTDDVGNAITITLTNIVQHDRC